jgi:hypothetical protein
MENLNGLENIDEQNITENILKKRSLISISFAVAVAFFFLAFADLKCNGVTVESLSGYNFVFGKHLSHVQGYGQTTDIFDQLSADRSYNAVGNSGPQTDRVKPNIWAIISLSAAIIGAIIFFKGGIKHENWLGVALGASGVLSLIILAVLIQNKISLQTANIALIEITFRAGYWLSVLAFAVAGTVSYFRLKYGVQRESKNEAPVISKLNVFISSSTLTKKDT